MNRHCLFLLFLFKLVFITTSCQSTKTIDETQLKKGLDTSSKSSLDKNNNISKNDSIENIPLETNKNVQKWINFFTGRGANLYQKFIDEGENYRLMIENILISKNLPTELYYLALIESGFNNNARSHANAVGVWQFIAPTGKRYGLKINRHIDERRDPVRATIAASHYLKDLYTVLQSWHLAIAAYNAGEIRLVRAVMSRDSRNFWDLTQTKNYLPRETRNYVPKFIAAVIIGRNLEKYGFRKPTSPSVPKLKYYKIPTPITISKLSKITGIQELKEYNRNILKDYIPKDKISGYEILVPKGAIPRIDGKITQIKKVAQSILKTWQIKNPNKHKVIGGESLFYIAKKYGISVLELKEKNALKSNRILVGQILKIPLKKIQL